MGSVTPFLWFDDCAEQAAELYVSVIRDSRIVSVQRGPDGSASSVELVLDGMSLHAFNGGPMFPFTEAISLFVRADTQDEIDRVWAALVADGGAESRCGWLKDRFEVSWQVVPGVLGELLRDPDPARSSRAVQAMLGMSKLDIAALRAAADGVDTGAPGA